MGGLLIRRAPLRPCFGSPFSYIGVLNVVSSAPVLPGQGRDYTLCRGSLARGGDGGARATRGLGQAEAAGDARRGRPPGTAGDTRRGWTPAGDFLRGHPPGTPGTARPRGRPPPEAQGLCPRNQAKGESFQIAGRAREKNQALHTTYPT